MGDCVCEFADPDVAEAVDVDLDWADAAVEAEGESFASA